MAARPFPPSPRRRALAQQSGLHTASPWVTFAVASIALLLALAATGPRLGRTLGNAVVAAINSPPASDARPAPAPDARPAPAPDARPAPAPDARPAPDAATASLSALPRTVLDAALPLLGAAALAALLAHIAQTRAVWLPRRRVRNAPAVDGGAIPRTRRTAGQLAATLTLAVAAFGWLWRVAPQLAALPSLPPAAQLSAAAGLLLSLAVAVAIAFVALGALDAVARHAAVAHALSMTSADKREDDRLAGADPRWQARRAQLARQVSPDEAISAASFLLLGDDLAVAIAWDPARRPIPTRTAAGRGARATQLLGLARRRQLAIHREPALAAALLDTGPIPDRHWPRLAEIIAAIHGRGSQTL